MAKKYDIYKNYRTFEIRWSKWLKLISNDNLIVTNIRMNNTKGTKDIEKIYEYISSI